MRAGPADVSRRGTAYIGYLLLCVWGSLRWGDALWCPPARLHYQPQAHALVGICLRTKTTKRAMPFGILTAGLSGTCWSLRFCSVLRQAVADTLAAWPTIPSGTWTSRLLLWPPWLRGLLLKYWRLFSQDPPPAAFGLVAAHSLKCTLLSWARQLHIDSDLRRIQGHRRQSGSDRSVSLYSRDDILPVLRLQRIVVEAIRAGFLPLQPMAVSFVFLTAANSFSGTTLHVLNSATYVHGCPRTPLSKASFLHGSYWPSARFCSCCINFWAKATCRCIVSSAATTLLLSPPAGKDFPWPPAPVQLGFKPDEEFSVDWSVFQESPQLTLFPSPADFLGFIAPVADLPS